MSPGSLRPGKTRWIPSQGRDAGRGAQRGGVSGNEMLRALNGATSTRAATRRACIPAAHLVWRAARRFCAPPDVPPGRDRSRPARRARRLRLDRERGFAPLDHGYDRRQGAGVVVALRGDRCRQKRHSRVESTAARLVARRRVRVSRRHEPRSTARRRVQRGGRAVSCPPA